MTEMSSQRHELVEAITREVLAALGAGPGAGGPAAGPGASCASCVRGCAAQCATKVRDIVAGGASRIEFQGRAVDFPADLSLCIAHTLLRPDATSADIVRL